MYFSKSLSEATGVYYKARQAADAPETWTSSGLVKEEKDTPGKEHELFALVVTTKEADEMLGKSRSVQVIKIKRGQRRRCQMIETQQVIEPVRYI